MYCYNILFILYDVNTFHWYRTRARQLCQEPGGASSARSCVFASAPLRQAYAQTCCESFDCLIRTAGSVRRLSLPDWGVTRRLTRNEPPRSATLPPEYTDP